MYGKVLFVNVGSAGRPKDGDPRASYVLLRSDFRAPTEVEGVRVTYEVEKAAQDVLAAGLPDALAEGLRRGR